MEQKEKKDVKQKFAKIVMYNNISHSSIFIFMYDKSNISTLTSTFENGRQASWDIKVLN